MLKREFEIFEFEKLKIIELVRSFLIKNKYQSTLKENKIPILNETKLVPVTH